jgi:2-methylcitrate dehydratase PrpD
MTDDAAWQLAQHVCSTDYADLPASAVESARRDILDTFGCMLGGSGSRGSTSSLRRSPGGAGVTKVVCCYEAPACRRHRRRC